ncbi:DMT family transporter [Streptomyces sp. BHT-5-2]|uniref:DMT family transporter n=1 Tax=Streptomyces sp. BHT-5-2 TaxID=2866715 RepID=UPI001C8F021A|nr:DMT family transporter [Streptomyces sp. BHT-5-2]QZL02455.1 DMT family transporter [Streptomyces sp. BHT-5-2]
MDPHAHRDPHTGGERRPEARAARSHGTVEPEHGATLSGPVERTTPEAPGRRMRPALVLPIIAALCFGCYTIWMDHTNGAKGGQAALLGLIAAVVTGALGVTLVHFQSTMITETRALAYGALFGASMGWLYSLGGSTPSVLKSTAWGLVMFGVMFIASLYVFRTHREREPHGLHRPRHAHTTRRPHVPHAAH